MTGQLKIRLRGLSAALLILLALLPAQSALPQDQGIPGPIRIITRVVNVNVVATDKKGNPVTDLTKDDFTISDEGRPQQVGFFSAIDNRHPPSTPAPLDPDTYTNEIVSGGATPSVTILLFDALHTQWASQAYGLHHLRQFLRKIQPQDHVGLYLLGDKLTILHPYQEDSSELIAAIHRYDERKVQGARKPKGGPGKNAGSALDRFLAGKDVRYYFDLMGKAGAAYALSEAEWRRQITSLSISAICRQLSSVEGRKSLVWITDSIGETRAFVNEDAGRFVAIHGDPGRMGLLFGFPSVTSGGLYEIDLAQLDREDIERMLRLMNDAGIAVYPVGAGGIAPFTPWLDIPSPQLPMSFRDIGGMMDLANHTGGRAFFNRNDVEIGILKAVDDSRFSYSLAFYPDHNKWNGEWRKIRVKVNRPGVRVLARSGYFALPDASPVPPKDRTVFLHEIAESPVESTQLPFSVHLSKSALPTGPLLHADVHVELQPMLTSRESGRQAGNFEVVFVQLGDADNPLTTNAEAVSANLRPDQVAQAFQKGWDLKVRFPIAHGATNLCVILHDILTDEVGSVRIPLKRYMTR